MAPYFDIYVGGKKCKLYLNKQHFNTYMTGGLSEGVYGQVLCTFDESSQTFHVNVGTLSDRAKYLRERGLLYIGCSVSSGGWRVRRKHGKNFGERERHVADTYHRGCSVRQIFEISDDLVIKADDIPISHSFRNLRGFHGSCWVDIRFILWSKLNSRALKTQYETFRIVQYKT